MELTFERISDFVRNKFYEDWENRDNSLASLEIQKRAIIGYQKEKTFFIERIHGLLEEFNIILDEEMPIAYKDYTIAEAVYNDVWGFNTLAPWFEKEAYKTSEKLLVKGENIYIVEHKHLVLLPQRINFLRKEQLFRALSLTRPNELVTKDHIEGDLLNGTHFIIDLKEDTMIFTRHCAANVTKADILLTFIAALQQNTSTQELVVHPQTVASINAVDEQTLNVTLKDGRLFEITISEKDSSK